MEDLYCFGFYHSLFSVSYFPCANFDLCSTRNNVVTMLLHFINVFFFSFVERLFVLLTPLLIFECVVSFRCLENKGTCLLRSILLHVCPSYMYGVVKCGGWVDVWMSGCVDDSCCKKSQLNIQRHTHKQSTLSWLWPPNKNYLYVAEQFRA